MWWCIDEVPLVEAEESEVQSHLRLYNNFEASLGYRRPYLKTKEGGYKKPYVSVGPQPSAQARLQRGKGDWDSWLIRAGLRFRLGRVKGAACRILFLLSFPLPGISFLNSAVSWALPMVLLKPSTNIYSSRLTSSQTASVVAETGLQSPEGSDCKFSAWSFRESTGKQMLFLGGSCHLRRVVPSGDEHCRPPVRERGRGCRMRERDVHEKKWDMS